MASNQLGDFEAGMLQFQSVAGRDVDASGLEKFHDLFLTLGKELPVSTKDVQMAAIEMVKGGIDPATIAAGGLRQNIQFAAAAMGGDLVKAAEISSKIMGGWAGVNATAAEKADFLTHATDLLAKAANASSTDVEGLALGIFNSQGIARTAGVSFDDLTTTLAALAPRFESSSVAGNSLKNMIARLQPTTDPAAQAMASLGLYTEETGSAFYDAAGNFVGFETAAQLLQDSLKGLTKEQQAATLQQIFGNDAMGAAAGLAELGAAGYTNMSEALLNANGVSEAAALKQQGFNTALDNAKGSVEAMQISIGEKLLPVLTNLLNNTIAPAINTFGDWAVAILDADDPMQALIKSIDEIAPGFQSFVTGVETGIGILIAIGETIDGLIGTFAAAEAETNTLGTAVDDLNGIWTKASEVVGNALNGYMAIAQAVLPIVTKFVDEHGAEIEAFFKTSWASIVEIVNLALDTYNAIVPPILNAIAGFIDDHGSEITKILGGVWEIITSLITGTLETIKGIFKTTLALINGDWEGAWKGIQGIADAQATAIGGIVSGFLDLIAGIFDTSMDEILGVWEHNWNAMVELVSDVGWWEAGKLVVEGIQQGIDQAWNSLMRWFNDKVSGLVDAAMEAIGAASPAKEFMPVGQFAVEGIMEGFSDTWPALTDLIGTLSTDLIDKMKDIGRDMQGIIADSFGATASIDRQIAKNLDSFKDVLPQYAAFTTDALKEAQSQAEGFLDPAEGARFFAMRSKQILEYAKLQKELAEAETADDRARIEAQMLLINRAQTAEISQFNANQTATQSASQQIADSISAVMAALSGVNLTDEQIKIVDMLSGVWAGLQAPMQSRADAYANPPQTQYPSGGSNTTSSTQNINMPIYTNNTPAALQQSWAVMQASMP